MQIDTLRRTKILFLDHTSKLGGGEIALLHLLEALDKTQFEPMVIVASNGPLVPAITAIGVDVQVIELDSKVVDTRKDTLGLSAILRLKQIFCVLHYAFRIAKFARKLGVNLIHTNSLKSDIYGGIAGRIANIPTLWHVRDRIDEAYLPKPVVHVFRSLCALLPRMVVANSKSTLDCLGRTQHPRLSSIVYDGVRLANISSCVPAPGTDAKTNSAPIIALVGRIAHWKGQHVFIRAASDIVRSHPNAQFWIVGAPLFGESEYEEGLHRQVESLDLSDYVRFLGFRDDVGALLAQTDVVVHASCLGEPFGQVVIEGMAAGKPVVATDGGAIPEIIADGITGKLVPMNDAFAMAGAVCGLLDDPDEARAIGLRARQHVLDRFTVDRTARSMERVYDRILGVGPSVPGAVLESHDLALKGA